MDYVKLGWSEETSSPSLNYDCVIVLENTSAFGHVSICFSFACYWTHLFASLINDASLLADDDGSVVLAGQSWVDEDGHDDGEDEGEDFEIHSSSCRESDLLSVVNSLLVQRLTFECPSERLLYHFYFGRYQSVWSIYIYLAYYFQEVWCIIFLTSTHSHSVSRLNPFLSLPLFLYFPAFRNTFIMKTKMES